MIGERGVSHRNEIVADCGALLSDATLVIISVLQDPAFRLGFANNQVLRILRASVVNDGGPMLIVIGVLRTIRQRDARQVAEAIVTVIQSTPVAGVRFDGVAIPIVKET